MKPAAPRIARHAVEGVGGQRHDAALAEDLHGARDLVFLLLVVCMLCCFMYVLCYCVY